MGRIEQLSSVAEEVNSSTCEIASTVSELNNVAESVVNSLKSSDSTKFYFEDDSPFDDNVQRFYQLKFKSTLQGIDFRCMADELIVVHNKKIVVPIDLKTSSKPEWDFYNSFIDWRYDIQARLYWKVIRDNMDKDPYSVPPGPEAILSATSFCTITMMDSRFKSSSISFPIIGVVT